MTTQTLLFQGTPEDKVYLPRLKSCVGSATVYVNLEPVTTVTEVIHYAKKKGCTGVFSTSKALLTKLLEREAERKQPSLDAYSGSYFFKDGIEIVFINPLDHLVSVNYGSFLVRRFISKLAAPEDWIPATPFNYIGLVTPANVESIYEMYSTAYAIAVDIETYKQNLAIRCIGYTAIFLDSVTGKLSSHSCVLPIDSEFAIAWMRKINWLPVPKIFQNGKYDVAYLARYDAPVQCWYWDTAHLFHSHYSELPKDLAFLQSFFVRNAAYWKDLADTNDLEQYYLYNAKDTWATANVWIAQMLQMPAWARENYLQEFPLVYPCHMSELRGIKRDVDRMTQARTDIDTLIASKSASLNTMLGVPAGQSFNVNSPIQMKALLKILGCGDLESADEKNLQKAAYRHPLNERIINLIVGPATASQIEEFGIRGLRKLKSTYLRTDEDITATSKGGAKELKGRILYALNPHGTDTARLASKEHHFWCGLQIQNIPRDRSVKQTLCADDGFLLAECDLEQAESRDTAHIAGDESLIKAVGGDRDFHSVNASSFFGRPYESIYDDEKGKTKDKPLRDLAKRVNHGANYNMGPNVLVDTMGLKNIYIAAGILKLPKHWTPKQIAEHLLAQFHKTYPKIAGVYYKGVVHEILTTRMLSSKSTHSCDYQASTKGWTRYCFGNPDKNKSDLNAYVAHAPQSLNACTLNKAFMRVFYDIALHPTHSKNFKLNSQIHDSILFQYRIGHEYLADMVKERMEIPVTITSYSGVVYTFTVPAAVKKGGKFWSELE